MHKGQLLNNSKINISGEQKYSTVEEAILAIQKSAINLSFCDLRLKNNPDLVMQALKKWWGSFEYASPEIKEDAFFIETALNSNINPLFISHASDSILSNTKLMHLATSKDIDGIIFSCAKGEAAENLEIAAIALVKYGTVRGEEISLFSSLPISIQDFFTKDHWFEKAQSYLIQLEQEKQAKMVSGGSTTDDGVIW